VKTQDSSVLAVGAHPDDIEFMMAGTLLLLKEAGRQIHYMNLCDGCCGTVTEDSQTIVARRKKEAQDACHLMGAHFHQSIASDLQLYHTTETVAKVVSVIRRVCPSILLLLSPQDYMEDHMNSCRIGVTAAFARGMRNFPCDPPVSPIHQDLAVYHALPYGLRDALRRRIRPGQYVNIASVLTMKRRILACHVSQKEWLDRSQGLDAYLDTMEDMARQVGVMSGRFEVAEGWRRHSNLGFSAADDDLMSTELGANCIIDAEYETLTEEGNPSFG